jgi:DNA-binding CsgD family transcriptional regulator
MAALTAAGSPAAGVVVADPGLGKTRLLDETVSRLDLPCVRLHGYEPAREIPLSATAGLLREFARMSENGKRLDGLVFGEGGGGSGVDAVRVFEAAFRCLVEFGPAAVVIDDIQWADGESLALLHYLLAAAGPADIPLLVLCASRPGGAVASFAAALGTLLSDYRLETVTLAPLGHDEGVELAVRLTPGLSDDEAAAVWEQAQGSPFWLQVLAVGDRSDATPARVIRARFAGLDADAGQLFALLVVAAHPLSVADAALLLAWDEGRVSRASVALANRALAVQEAGAVRIAHDLIRETVEGELAAADKRHLHERLAAWFEAGAGTDLQGLSRALEHRQAAGLPTVELALQILGSPQRRLLGRDGLEMLDGIAAEGAGPAGLALARGVAALASELGEWALALDRWATLAERLPDGHGRAQAALAAAYAAVRLERADEAYLFVERARVLAPTELQVAIEADLREGQALRWLENRTAEAQALTDRAAAAAQQLVEQAGGADALGDVERRLYLASLRAQVDAAIRAGDADTVARAADEITRAAREPAEALAGVFDGIFSLIMFEGLPRPAEPRARRALEESRRLVLPVLEVEASHWLGWTLHYLGRLEEAETVTRQTVALAERVGSPERFSLPNLKATSYSVSASRGDWRRWVGEIEGQIGELHDPHYRLNVRMMHLPLLVRFAPQPTAALDDLLAAMQADADAAGCERCWQQSTLFSAEARSRVGDLTGARAALAAWDAAQPRPRAGPAARRAYVEALVESGLHPEQSLPLYEQAAELAERAGQRLIWLWVHLDTAATLAIVDREQAVAAFRSAARAAEEMGALSERHLAVQRLRTLGVRTWRRGPMSGDGALTAREREIASLVAAGVSNPEIAQKLFLSRKTVERHVSNILRKIGAKNRTELASRLRVEGAGAADAGAHR